MREYVTIEQLLGLCRYGTHINIKLADSGAIAINGVANLENSTDKRQMAKWEAFREKPVFDICGGVEMADLKRHHDDIFRMNVEASILRNDYDDAMKEYKSRIMRRDVLECLQEMK